MRRLSLLCLLLMKLSQAMKLPECSIYDCFILKKCKTSTSTQKKFISYSEDDEISDTCPFVLRYHKHEAGRYTVVMESFDSAIKTMELKKGKTASIFKCAKDAAGQMTLTSGDNKISFNMVEPLEKADKVKCFFEATKEGSDLLEEVEYEINDGTNSYVIELKIKEYCDPTVLKFEKNVADKKVVYQPIESTGLKKYIFEIGGCQTPIQTREYRLENEQEYQDISSITCPEGAYLINGERRIPKNVVIYIRCKSDAQYHCAYDPKYKANEQKLTLTPPNFIQKKIGTLKCPDSHKFLVIGNKIADLNTSISCTNHNGRLLWTSSKGRVLQTSGPEVYCREKLDCPTISSKSVKSGYLDQKFPKCAKDGLLSIHEDGKEVTGSVFNFKCDGNDGKNKFNTSDGFREITSETTFKCNYLSNAEELNAANTKKIIGSSLIPIVVGAVAVVLGIVLFGLYMKNNTQKKAEAFKITAAAREKAEYDKFIANQTEQLESKVDGDEQALTSNMQKKRSNIQGRISLNHITELCGENVKEKKIGIMKEATSGKKRKLHKTSVLTLQEPYDYLKKELESIDEKMKSRRIRPPFTIQETKELKK